jgi:F-type H+-transporting ATPase subunit a
MEVVGINLISPDQVVFFRWGFVTINATIVYTWLIMVLLMAGSLLATRHLTSEASMSRGQNFFEVVVGGIRGEIGQMLGGGGDAYLPFIGGLFLFIALSNLLVIIPGYVAPTSSLTTTAALAVSVFVAVPVYGISRQGIREYVKEYFRPTFIFFPFHVMGELSRTLALAVRLFGNIMSHEKIIAILLSVTPFLFPVVMQALGLLIGIIQAYIFAVLAMVYIASAVQAHDHEGKKAAEAVAVK